MTDERGPLQPALPGNGSRRYWRVLVALFAAGLAVFMQMYAPQGLLPDVAREFDATVGGSSWVIGATTIGVAVGVIPLARLGDRWGRLPVMQWTLLAAVLLGLAAPFMPTFASLIAVRAALGVMLAGVPATVITALAESVDPRALGGAVGIYLGGTTVGGLAGRIVSASAADLWGFRGGILVVAVVVGAAAIVFVLLMPPPVIDRGSPRALWPTLLACLRNPGVMALVAQAFLLMGGFVAVYNTLAFRLQADPFQLSLAGASWIFLAYLAGTVTSRWVWQFTRWLGPLRLTLVCFAIMLAGLAATLVPALPVIVVGLVVYTGGFFAAHSLATGLLERRAGSDLSVASPLYNLGYYAGSSLLGWAGGAAFSAAGWIGALACVVAGIVVSGLLIAGYRGAEQRRG